VAAKIAINTTNSSITLGTPAGIGSSPRPEGNNFARSVVDGIEAPGSRPGTEEEEPSVQLPLQVTFDGIPPSPALREHIEDQLHKLARIARSITHAKVTIDVVRSYSSTPLEFAVRLELKVPHHPPVVVRAARGKDAYGCVLAAVARAQRVLSGQLDQTKTARRQGPATAAMAATAGG
jgi:ribosome-associated translation inhibitor RaiA